MSNDYNPLELQTAVNKLVSKFRGSPTAIADLAVKTQWALEQDLADHKKVQSALLKRAEAAEARAERYERWLQRIDNWAKAYPLDVFPEPDFKQVYVVLKAAGISLDQVSASNMRHVIQGIEGMVQKALKGGEE